MCPISMGDMICVHEYVYVVYTENIVCIKNVEEMLRDEASYISTIICSCKCWYVQQDKNPFHHWQAIESEDCC